VYRLREPGSIISWATVRKEQSLDEAKEALVEAVEGMASESPSLQEVEIAKAALLKGIELQAANSGSAAYDLTEWISVGDWRLMFVHRDRLKAVTPDDVRRVASK
jgi:zinc protease